ncbi:hypothetical protein MRX96_026275 [Rhipicephalus microplus]
MTQRGCYDNQVMVKVSVVSATGQCKVEDHKGVPHGQQAEKDGACKPFAIFIVFTVILLFGFSLLFGASKSSTPQSIGRRELSTERPRPKQLTTNKVPESSMSREPVSEKMATTPELPLEDVTTSIVATYEHLTGEASQDERASTT